MLLTYPQGEIEKVNLGPGYLYKIPKAKKELFFNASSLSERKLFKVLSIYCKALQNLQSLQGPKDPFAKLAIVARRERNIRGA